MRHGFWVVGSLGLFSLAEACSSSSSATRSGADGATDAPVVTKQDGGNASDAGKGGRDAKADTSIPVKDGGHDASKANDASSSDASDHDVVSFDAPASPDGSALDAAMHDAGADAAVCEKITSLHPPAAGETETVYCPFSSLDGGRGEYCTPASQHCCDNSSTSGVPSSCQPLGTLCSTGSIDFHCADPVADCTSGTPVCCAPSATLTVGAPGCGNAAAHLTSTTCVAQGSCSGLVLCTSDAECPVATPTCTPFDARGDEIGACQ